MSRPIAMSTTERQRDLDDFQADVFDCDDSEYFRQRLELAWLRGMGDVFKRIAAGEEAGFVKEEENDDARRVD